MTYGIALLAQTSSLRSFQDCQSSLFPIVIMFAGLAVFTFAGGRIAKWWKEKAVFKGLKNKVTCTLVAAAVIAVAAIFSLFAI